jgi:hypothetical protein
MAVRLSALRAGRSLAPRKIPGTHFYYTLSRPQGHSVVGEKTPGTHWIEGWLGPRTGLDDVEKRKFLTLPGLKLRHLGCPALSQSLYRLRYPGSSMT